MTGGGRGLCVLRLPDGPGERLIGTAGRLGWPVGPIAQGQEDELLHLRSQARRIEGILRTIHDRIEHLEAARRREPVGA